MASRKLVVEIVGDASSLEKSYRQAGKSTQAFGREIDKASHKAHRGFGGLLKTGIGVGAGFAAAQKGISLTTSAIRAAFDELQQSQQVAAQTQAALKSTGEAANVSAKHVDQLAEAMLRKSGIDDEATKTAENMLLTFRGVRNEVGKGNQIFDQATQAVADLATRLEGGAIPSAEKLQQVSVQVGKALNDPIKGVSALTRVGVSFTAAQKDQIKALVESGHRLQAQKVILGELRSEFGGSAKAAGSTFAGSLAKVTETLRNMAAEILQRLMPTIERIADRFARWATDSRNQKKILDTVDQVVGTVAAAVKVLSGALAGLNKITGSTKRTLELLLGVLVAYKGLQLAASIRNLAGSFGLLRTQTAGATGSVRSLRGSLVGKAGLAAAVVLAGYELSKLIRKIPHWDNAMKRFGGTLHDLAASLGLVSNPGAQFAGKTVLSQAASRALRQAAARLEAGGMSAAAAAARLARTHPNVALHDLQVLAGVYGSRPVLAAGGGGTTIHIGHFHSSAPDAKALENDLIRRSRQRPHVRRGAR